jgi:hypothetical protein
MATFAGHFCPFSPVVISASETKTFVRDRILIVVMGNSGRQVNRKSSAVVRPAGGRNKSIVTFNNFLA